MHCPPAINNERSHILFFPDSILVWQMLSDYHVGTCIVKNKTIQCCLMFYCNNFSDIHEQLRKMGIWAALCKKVPNILSRCHTNDTDLKKKETPPNSPPPKKKKNLKCWCHTFFWYDTDSGHKGPFCITQPISQMNVLGWR